MYKQYGRSKKYIYDYDNETYVNPKNGKTIKDYEYEGLAAYEEIKTIKGIRNRNNITKGMTYASAALTAIGSAKVVYDNLKKK